MYIHASDASVQLGSNSLVRDIFHSVTLMCIFIQFIFSIIYFVDKI